MVVAGQLFFLSYKVGLENVKWIHVAHGREHDGEPSGSIKGKEFLV
jgi:hypothetical protein